MLEVKPIGQRGRTATGNGQNGNEAVAGSASEVTCAVNRSCPRRTAIDGTPIVSPHDTVLLLVGIARFWSVVVRPMTSVSCSWRRSSRKPSTPPKMLTADTKRYYS